MYPCQVRFASCSCPFLADWVLKITSAQSIDWDGARFTVSLCIVYNTQLRNHQFVYLVHPNTWHADRPRWWDRFIGYVASFALYRFWKQKYQKGFTNRKLRVATSDRGVGTCFDTCSKLGQLSQYNFKNLYDYFPESSIKKFKRFWYLVVWNFLRPSLIKPGEISFLLGLFTWRE